jgi:hypothetical protein
MRVPAATDRYDSQRRGRSEGAGPWAPAGWPGVERDVWLTPTPTSPAVGGPHPRPERDPAQRFGPRPVPGWPAPPIAGARPVGDGPEPTDEPDKPEKKVTARFGTGRRVGAAPPPSEAGRVGPAGNDASSRPPVKAADRDSHKASAVMPTGIPARAAALPPIPAVAPDPAVVPDLATVPTDGRERLGPASPAIRPDIAIEADHGEPVLEPTRTVTGWPAHDVGRRWPPAAAGVAARLRRAAPVPAEPVDPWPDLPDDTPLWTHSGPIHDQPHQDLLEREQRGARWSE